MFESLHTLNIAVHVGCGIAALALGLWQLATAKGGDRHRRVGRWFSGAVWIVVVTATIGLVVFRFGAFLAVLTLLVAYWLYSGIRAARTRETGPTRQDAVVSVSGLVAVALFLYFLPRIRFPWVPTVIYSSLGTLTVLALYDLTRFIFPRRWWPTLWVYEHAVKMIGAHGAIVSAFAGTVFPSWQPFSQTAPSAIWGALQLGFVIRLFWQSRKSAAAVIERRVA